MQVTYPCRKTGQTDRHGPAHKPKLFIVEVWKQKEGLGINCSPLEKIYSASRTLCVFRLVTYYY
jgi:hypothetical protein